MFHQRVAHLELREGREIAVGRPEFADAVVQTQRGNARVVNARAFHSRRQSKFAPRHQLSLDELMPEREELERLERARQDSPETSVLRAEDAERVRQAVLQLPPAYRLILVLHDMEELSTAEAAKITGLREGTVRVRLHRARLFLLENEPQSLLSERPQSGLFFSGDVLGAL